MGDVVKRAQTDVPAIMGGVDVGMLIAKAIEKESPLEVMERLLAMQREAQAEFARRSFFDALAVFQSECPVIQKDSSVDFESKRGGRVRYKYAALDTIVSTIKEPLRKNGFSYTITTKQVPESVTAICTAHHKDGHSESTDFTIPVDPEAFMNAAQKVASALTYAKRYAFCNAFGILTGDQDDDAAGAGDPPEDGGTTEPEREQNDETLYTAIGSELDKGIINTNIANKLRDKADQLLEAKNHGAMRALYESVKRQTAAREKSA